MDRDGLVFDKVFKHHKEVFIFIFIFPFFQLFVLKLRKRRASREEISNMQLLDRLKRFDAYPKTLEEVQVRTTSGATISIVSMVIIFVLVVSEFSAYISTGTHHELYVDTTVGEQLQINFDVTFPRLACAYVSVDLMDVSGNHELDVDHNIFKKRLSSDGIPVGEDVLARVLGDPLIEIPEKRPGCGTCYSAERSEAQCCNTCTEVMDAYRSRGWAVSQPETIAQCQREGYNQLLKEQKDEGCQLYGTLQVSKVCFSSSFLFFLLPLVQQQFQMMISSESLLSLQL